MHLSLIEFLKKKKEHLSFISCKKKCRSLKYKTKCNSRNYVLEDNSYLLVV